MRGFRDVSAEKWALWVSVTALCVSVITCLLVLLFMVRHGQRDTEAIGYLNGRVDSAQKQISVIQGRIDTLAHENPTKVNELRLRLFEIESELTKVRGDLDFEAAKAQNLRERLLKEGRVN